MRHKSLKIKNTVELRLEVPYVYYDVQMVPYEVKPEQCVHPALARLAAGMKAVQAEQNK